MLDNFRSTRAFGSANFRSFKTFRQDKGHIAEVTAFLDRVSGGGEPPIPFKQLENVSRATFAALESVQSRRMVDLREARATKR